METLWQDVKYGARMLLKNRGVTVIAILTLALGIGANTAVFSVVRGVLLKPLPYDAPERIVAVYTNFQARGRAQDIFSPANYLDLAAQNQSFEAVGAHMYNSAAYSGGDEPVSLTVGRVTDSFFRVLAAKPLLGRTFLPEEEVPGRNNVAVLSYGTWQAYFGGDREILGRAIRLDSEPVTVVGVMPDRFATPPGAQIWMPFAFPEQLRQARGAIFINVIARRKPGVSFETANAEVAAIGRRLAQDYPANAGMGMHAQPLFDATVRDVRLPLQVLAGAVGFVLLIACANLSNLLLSAASARRREMTVRLALGASRARLVRQLLTESVLLALAGGTLGWLFAQWTQPALISLASAGAQTNIPRLEEVQLDGIVFLFALAISLVAGVAFGLLPALGVAHSDIQEGLRQAGRGTSAGPRVRRLSGALVVGQVALVLALLVGAGLLIESFAQLRSVHPGFSTERIISAQLFLPRARYGQDPQRFDFARKLVERIQALPGVESAALASPVPIGAIPIVYDVGFQIAGRAPAAVGEQPAAYETTVTPGYFQTMGIPLLRGRVFQEGDDAASRPVAIISEALARKYFPNDDPIGRHILVGARQPVSMEIVGVVADVKHVALTAPSRPELYYPYLQRTRNTVNLVVRTQGEPRALLGAVKAQVWETDRELPVRSIHTMNELVSLSLSQERFQTILLGAFAGLALVLAAVGLYGVLAHSVSQRTQEIGVRLALGAQRSDVFGMVIRQGITLTGAGLVIGFFLAFGLTRFLRSLLYEVSATNPGTFLLVAVLLAGVTLLACFLPARRATRVDPIVALRYE